MCFYAVSAVTFRCLGKDGITYKTAGHDLALKSRPLHNNDRVITEQLKLPPSQLQSPSTFPLEWNTASYSAWRVWSRMRSECKHGDVFTELGRRRAH